MDETSKEIASSEKITYLKFPTSMFITQISERSKT